MDARRYLARVDKIRYQKLECSVCGTEALTPSTTDTICQFCESYVPNETTASGDSKEALLRITDLLAEKRWDDASELFPKYAGKMADPLVTYGAGIFYWYYSDKLYYDKNYALKGYMEKNAENVSKALYATVEAKRYLYKSMRAINDLTARVAPNEMLLFTKFSIDMRLRRPYMAAKTLVVLNSIGKNDLVRDYANMAYAVVRGTKDAERLLDRLLARGELNAFYYLSKHLVKTKRLKEALIVLNKITSMAHMPMAEELIKKIASTQEARSLA